MSINTYLLHLLSWIYTRTDYTLTQDKSFKKWAKTYAEDQDLWFKEYEFFVESYRSLCVRRSFANALSRLFELGVPTHQFTTSEPWYMKTTDEQAN